MLSGEQTKQHLENERCRETSKAQRAFSPIRNSAVCLTAICLFQLAVLGGCALSTPYPTPTPPPPIATVALFLSNLPPQPSYPSSVHPNLRYCYFFFFFFYLPPPPPLPLSAKSKRGANEGGLRILLPGHHQEIQCNKLCGLLGKRRDIKETINLLVLLYNKKRAVIAAVCAITKETIQGRTLRNQLKPRRIMYHPPWCCHVVNTPPSRHP